MKTFIQMMLKCALIFSGVVFLVLHLSEPAANELKHDFLMGLIERDALTQKSLQSALSSYRIEEIQKEWDSFDELKVPVISEKQKKIYLYNTHQSEEYIDGITIFEVTYQFAKLLKQAGFDVTFETSDFISEMNQRGLKYNQLYVISRAHLLKAIEQEGPFDLIVDVHRDSAKRSVSVMEKDGISYGRLMFVIGNRSQNAESVQVHSASLTDKMNQRLSGIMRAPFIRQSVYNQDAAEHMLLLEVGSDQNTSSEVLRSLEILVDVLVREGLS